MPAAYRLLPIVLALAAPLPAAANGVLYFVTGPVTILGADGKARPARKGDQVHERERIVTGTNAMAQLRMEDGSFVGVRPDSEMGVQAFRATGTDAGSVLVLERGSVRVLNLETDAKARPLPVQLQAGDGAAVTLRGGDLEAGKPGGAFVNRLNAGAAVAQTNQGNLALAVHSVNTVTPTSIAPTAVAALPPIVIAAAKPSTLTDVPQPLLGTLSSAVMPSAMAASNLASTPLPPNLAQAMSATRTPPLSSGDVVGTILQARSPTGPNMRAAAPPSGVPSLGKIQIQVR